MPFATPPKVRNLLLAGLPRKDRERFLESCEAVDLTFGQVLCDSRSPLRSAYFPLTGYVSLVTSLGDHLPIEMGLIGNEGMLGVTLMLGVDAAPLRGVVRGKGTALRMSAVEFRRQLRASPSLRRKLHRYLYVLMEQLSTSAACNHFHEVAPRLARWLLMTHDRAHADHFHLTHAYLAGMLGVRRSGITVAAGMLKRDHLIRYTRGVINILDRSGLESACCECYTTTADDYARLLA